MEQNFSAHWISGAVLGLICLLCCIALFFVSEPSIEKHKQQLKKILPSIFNVIKDLWSVVRSHKGYLALLICFLPIGTAAASNLWSAVAGDWNASAVTVELATGLLSGIISAAGCIAGGYICDKMDKKTAYGLYGFSQALCVVGMALAPRTEIMFIIFTSLYSFLAGLSYAGFSAVTFEAIGRGAVATKYSLFASLSNMPIAYMTIVDGWAHTRWGSNGMLNTEAIICMAALLLFGTVVIVVRRSISNVPVLSSPPAE